MVAKKKFPHKTSALGRGLDDMQMGQGLDALIDTTGVRTKGSSTISEVPLSQIEANPNQPRREFDETALRELAASIEQIGIVQPITLRQVDDDHYQIIAGERRWRASQIAGLEAIPAYIRTISDENVMEMALVENIQREDLNAIEIALAYQHLLEGSGMTQEKVAERVGKSRTAVTNYLRLLRLPAQVQMALQKKEIDMGHARAILSIESPSMQLKLFNETQKNGYSVRKVEERAAQMKDGTDAAGNGTKTQTSSRQKLPEEYSTLQQRLSDTMGVKVKLSCTPQGKGSITLPFSNEYELQQLITLFDKIK